ncbi:unnamed protein product [Ectocarpus sp. CCAP 1310/34]|nr:unnamed protein product [Ectocarpus sp. CCAP 1310/34]
MVALACKYDLEFLHFDVEQAFAQSELDHEFFMKLPPGCKSMSALVVRVDKSLDGLRQACRKIHKRLVSNLKRISVEQSLSDPCVVRFMMRNEVIGMIAIHVDDILHGGIESLAKIVVQALGDSFTRRVLARSNSFLVAHLVATAKLARLTCLKRVASGVFSRDSIFVAPARSLLPLLVITGP